MTMKQVPTASSGFHADCAGGPGTATVAIAKDLPVTDVKSLLAFAKEKGGKATFAVGSIGSAGHLATELLIRTGGNEYTVVPYKGTAPAFQDLLGGRIDGFIDPILGSLGYHKAGQLRVVRHVRDPYAESARCADRRRDHSGFRVLQLVRTLGPGETAGRHSGTLERRGEQGARLRHA